MVVVEEATCEAVMLSVIFGELEREWAISGSFAVSLCTLVGWLSLLASVAVENVDAVAVGIVSFSSLRYKLDVHGSENVIDSISDAMHI